jgi:hypothetical protein
MIDNNVFNKVVNDILLQVKPVYLRKQIATEFLDLITRMQEEKSRPKKILANRVYADTTLMSMTKAELIEHIRILEHNWSAAEETLANSVKNSEQIFYEQKEEIERLTERLDYFQKSSDYHEGNQKELETKNAELQKQVDDYEKVLNYFEERDIFCEDCKKQVVEATVKKYHDAIKELFDKQECCGCIEDRSVALWHQDNDKIARQHFSVEVE